MARFSFSIEKSMIIVFAFLAYCTYVTQYYFLFGEVLSEGFPLLVGLVYLFIVVRPMCSFTYSNIGKPIVVFSVIYLLWVFVATCVLLFVGGGEGVERFIFVYQYLPLLLLFTGLSPKRHIDHDAVFVIVAGFCALSAIIGILQVTVLYNFPPLDEMRARGLSRSTLNYSSLMFLGFVAAKQINNIKVSFVLSAVIFGGAFVSLSRGALMSLLFFVLIYTYNRKLGKYFIVLIILFVVWLLSSSNFGINNYFDNYLLSQRLLDYSFSDNDYGNVDRYNLYLSFFDQFTLLGHGFGSTGPAASRFGDVTGFESYILALIYQSGFGFLFLTLSMLFFIVKHRKEKSVIAVIASYLVMMLFQQTFETPVVNIVAWIVLFASIRRAQHSMLNDDGKYNSQSFIVSI